MYSLSSSWKGGKGGLVDAAELSRILKVSDHRRNTAKSGQNRSESLCDGLRFRAVYFRRGLAPLEAQGRLEIEDFRPDP